MEGALWCKVGLHAILVKLENTPCRIGAISSKKTQLTNFEALECARRKICKIVSSSNITVDLKMSHLAVLQPLEAVLRLSMYKEEGAAMDNQNPANTTSDASSGSSSGAASSSGDA